MDLPPAPQPHETWEGVELWRVRGALSRLARIKRKLDEDINISVETFMGTLRRVVHDIRGGELAPIFAKIDDDGSIPDIVAALRLEVEQILEQLH